MYDKIENSFSEKFDPKEIRSEGWNEPSDKIWDKIELDLYKKERKSFGFLPFLLASLLLMSLIFIGYLYFQNLDLKDSINKSELKNRVDGVNSFGNANSTIPILMDDLSESENLTSIADKVENQKKESVVKKAADRLEESLPMSQDFENKESLSSNDKMSFPTKTYFMNSSITNKLDEETVFFTSDDEVVQKMERSRLAFSEIISKKISIEYQEEVEAFPIIKIEAANKYRRPFVSILPNVAGMVLNTQGSQESALTELIDKEYGNCGLGIDLTYTVPLSQSFDLAIGIGMESVSFSTEYDIILPYDTEDETLEGEHGYIDFEHSLPTAFGNTATALRLSRLRSSDVLNEPKVGLDFNTNHNFLSMALPIGLRYRVNSGRSYFDIGFNARPTYIMNARSSIKSVFSHHSGIAAINNESFSTYSEIRKFNLSLGIDVGYNLFITERSGLQLRANYQHYMFDFYDENEFSSSVRKIGVSFGYFYSM